MAQVPVLRVPDRTVLVPERVGHQDRFQPVVPGEEAVDVGQCIAPRRKPVDVQAPKPQLGIRSAFQLAAFRTVRPRAR